MKKRLIFLLIGAIICTLSACGQRKDIEYNQADISNNATSTEDVTDDVEKELTSSDNATSTEDVTDDVKEEITASDNVTDDLIVNELEKLAGEYEYLSDYGAGRLIIEKNEYAYDISDYESQSSYRFLADSSNIESIENNRIYIKYPEQVFQDDTVIFCYYILEYGEDEMDVYYKQSEQTDEQLLYHATKKN